MTATRTPTSHIGQRAALIGAATALALAAALFAGARFGLLLAIASAAWRRRCWSIASGPGLQATCIAMLSASIALEVYPRLLARTRVRPSGNAAD